MDALNLFIISLQSVKEKELVNEKSKLAEMEEIKCRQEKEITKLNEELKSHKQESMKVGHSIFSLSRLCVFLHIHL